MAWDRRTKLADKVTTSIDSFQRHRSGLSFVGCGNNAGHLENPRGVVWLRLEIGV